MIAAVYVVAAAALFGLGMIFAFFGGLIFVILAAALAGLKLTGIVSWSWWWVMLPLWAAIDGAVVKMRTAARDPQF
jgi:hypothetical protein